MQKIPPYGAIFTYNLPKLYSSLKSKRIKKEKELDKLKKDVPFPGWKSLDNEQNEIKPNIFLEIRDKDGNLIDRVKGSVKKGINRVSWNLTKPNPITLNTRGYQSSIPVKPGNYSVKLFESYNGQLKQLTNSKSFVVKRIRENVLTNPLEGKIDNFIDELNNFELKMSEFLSKYDKAKKKHSTFK